MSNSGNKRQRSHNFSIIETECLVEEVLKRASVIENKKSDAITWKRKETAWADLAEAFNVQTSTNRTVKMLKIRYDGMKRTTKQKHNQGKAEQFKTVTYAPWEEKLLRLLSLSVEAVKSQNEVEVNHAAEMDMKDEFMCSNQEDDSSSEVSEQMHIIPSENVVEEISNERICDAWTPEILKTPRNKKFKISTKERDRQQKYFSIISSLPDLIDVQRKVAERELAKIAEEMEFLRKEDARKEQEHRLRIKFSTAEHKAKMELLKLQKDQLLK